MARYVCMYCGYVFDEEKGEVVYVKNQVGVELDERLGLS